MTCFHTWRWTFPILPADPKHGRYTALPLPPIRRCRCGAIEWTTCGNGGAL